MTSDTIRYVPNASVVPCQRSTADFLSLSPALRQPALRKHLGRDKRVSLSLCWLWLSSLWTAP